MTYNNWFLLAIEYEYYVLDIPQHMLPMLDIVQLMSIYFRVLLNRHHLNRLDKNSLNRPIHPKNGFIGIEILFFITFSKQDWNISDWFVNEIHSLIAAGVIAQLLITGGTSGHFENREKLRKLIVSNTFLHFYLISIDFQNQPVLTWSLPLWIISNHHLDYYYNLHKDLIEYDR